MFSGVEHFDIVDVCVSGHFFLCVCVCVALSVVWFVCDGSASFVDGSSFMCHLVFVFVTKEIFF